MEGVQFSESVACWSDCAEMPAYSQSVWMQWFLDSELNWSKSEPRQAIPCYWMELPEDAPFASAVVCFGADGGVVDQAVLREEWKTKVTCPCDEFN